MDEGFANDIRENGSGGMYIGVIPPYSYISLLLANESPQSLLCQHFSLRRQLYLT